MLVAVTPWKVRCFGISGGLSVGEWEATTGEPSVLATPTVEYTRGPDMGGGVGGLLYSVRSSAAKFNLSNGRGDIVAQSDSTGALSWTASYEAYGKRTKETGVNEDKQRANSKDEDPTGLLNEGFRYRDLETGVFLSRDPAGFVDGPNLYAYVKQNPWTSFDPNGLWLEDLVIGIPSIGIGAVSLWNNIKEGNVGAAVVDGIGIVADGAAIALPGIPGGAGLAIKASRATLQGAQKLNKIVETAQQVEAASDTIVAAAEGRWDDAAMGVAEMGVERLAGDRRGKNLESFENQKLANDLHESLPGFAQRRSTSSVGRTPDGEYVAATSWDKPLPQHEKWAADNNVRLVPGKDMHAEDKLMELENVRSFEIKSMFGREVTGGIPKNPNGAMCGNCAPKSDKTGAFTRAPRVDRKSSSGS